MIKRWLVSLRQELKTDRWTIAALVTIVVFGFLRVWRLGFPTDTVFDEVYFPKMAHQYLIHQPFFDIHPPLGKLMIAVSEFILGNTPVGWRMVSLLAGLALIPAAAWASWQLFHDRRAAWLSAVLFAIDGMMIVYSRTGLMDGFILLFGMLAIGFCWRFINQRKSGDIAWPTLFWTGFFAGLAVAVKWIGVGFLPLVAITTLIVMVTDPKYPFTFKHFWAWLAIFVLMPAILYTVPFLANWQSDFWHQFAQWHQQAWDYNVHLNATHPYASKWWSWPFLIRPIWFYYQVVNGKIVGVDGIGNPIIWWGTTLAIIYTLMALIYTALVWKRPSQQVIDRPAISPILFLVAGWASFYLPWTVIGRVLFLYHYLSSYLFALLIAAYWLSQSMVAKKGQKIQWSLWLVGIGLAAAVGVALFFAPVWIAYPIPQAWFNHLMWFRSWI